jgi:hypothetical protein
MNDARVAELLDSWTPSYADRHGDWERVAAAGGLRRRRLSARWEARAAAVAVVAAAVAAAVLAWPFASNGPRLLDRALAAVGNGPVLHVVLRGEWGGTLVDLSTGARVPVYGDNEIWFDTESGQTHQITRLGSVVQDEELSKPNKPEAELAALGREYRQALESGTARVTGEDTIDGEAVVWLTIHSELLPDVADGKDHEWAQQVAVSKQTYKPVALRETRDGQPGPDTLQRVLDLQMVARDAADFTTTRPSLNGTAFKQGRTAIDGAQAAAILGQTPLWLGAAYADLPMAQVYRETTAVGHQSRVRVTGALAAAAIKCSQQRSGGGDCFRSLGLMSSVEVRPDGVFISKGAIQWDDEQDSVGFFYGTIGDDPSTYRTDSIPLYDKPYLTVTESTQASPFRRGVGSYVPPLGSVFLTNDGHTGTLQRAGLQITIEAGSEETILAAARALTPMAP